MNILIIILLILTGIITLVLVLAALVRKKHYVKREIVIDAPSQKVFDFLKFLKNQEKFNKDAAADSDRKKEFKGTDGTVGFIYAWSGNKDAGVGQKEIKNIVEGKRIEMEICFVKPMSATATVVLEIESLSNDQSKVYWSNAGTLKFPINILIPVMEKAVAKSMDGSLSTLKNILETSLK